MKRRTFIAGLGGAAAWPLVARGQQQPATPVIGFLGDSSPVAIPRLTAGFKRGLAEMGYVEGQSITIEDRWADGQNNRLPALAADLVRRQVAVLATEGSVAALTAKAATTVIPIVFAMGGDPIKLGLVPSLSRPSGNITGVSFLSVELSAKRLGLLRELIPTASSIAILVNSSNPAAKINVSEIQSAADDVGLDLHVLNASTAQDIDQAFGDLTRLHVAALIVSSDPFLSYRRDQIIALASRHAIPAIYGIREWVVSGGLMSYGTDYADAFRQAGVYCGKILKGAKPADLPVEQPTKFELVFNLKTAKALGLDIPPSLLARADEVIE